MGFHDRYDPLKGFWELCLTRWQVHFWLPHTLVLGSYPPVSPRNVVPRKVIRRELPTPCSMVPTSCHSLCHPLHLGETASVRGRSRNSFVTIWSSLSPLQGVWLGPQQVGVGSWAGCNLQAWEPWLGQCQPQRGGDADPPAPHPGQAGPY